MLKKKSPMIEKQKRMGGKLKVTIVRKKPTIVNINKLEIRELNPDEMGFQNSVFASIVKGRHKSKPVRTLLDTGATYSVIHYDLLKCLSDDGLELQMVKTIRKSPVSASNHSLQIIGDVILN